MQTDITDKVIGVVLTGGKSRRMGKDKALICIDKESFLQKTVNILKQINLDMIIVAGERSSLQQPISDVVYLSDKYQGLGPLSGIQSALHYVLKDEHRDKKPIDGMLVLPIDMPNLTVDILSFLVREGKHASRPACYESHGKKLHFPLYMPVNMNLAEQIENLLTGALETNVNRKVKQKTLSVRNLLKDSKVQSIDINQQQTFININTPEDLKYFKSQRLTIGK